MKCNHAALRQTLCSIDMYNPSIAVSTEISNAKPSNGQKSIEKQRDRQKATAEKGNACVPCVFSVLQPTETQKRACADAKRRRGLDTKSRWTLLTNWNVDQYEQTCKERKAAERKAKGDVTEATGHS